MPKDRRWMIRFDPVTAKRIELRAEEQGASVAQLLRTIIEAEVKRDARAETLAELSTEITLVSGMMIRRLLTHAIGPEEARSLEEWANGRAAAVIQGEVRERRTGS